MQRERRLDVDRPWRRKTFSRQEKQALTPIIAETRLLAEIQNAQERAVADCRFGPPRSKREQGHSRLGRLKQGCEMPGRDIKCQANAAALRARGAAKEAELKSRGYTTITATDRRCRRQPDAPRRPIRQAGPN